jgi:tetratricopeptide (TPR) repeat protein
VTARRSRIDPARHALHSKLHVILTRLIPLGFVAALAAGCSAEKKALAEIREAYARGQYEETVALCRHAVRRDRASAEVHYLHGAALVALGRDFEGFRKLEEGARGDEDWASAAAELLLARGRADVDAGNRSRGARRLREAAEIRPGLALGSRRYLVARAYFEDKDYARAASHYDQAVREYPDTVGAEEAALDLAAAYAALGQRANARETLTALLARRPQGRLRAEASWRLANLTYEEAEQQFVVGSYDAVPALVEEMLSLTNNRGLEQKGHFLLGEAYEAMGEFTSAYEQYREVIRDDRGASGRIVERAKEKIAAMREAGLL